MFFEIITLAVVFTAFVAILRNLGKKLSKNEPTETLDSPAVQGGERLNGEPDTKATVESALLVLKPDNADINDNDRLLQEARKSYERALQFMQTAKGFSPVGILGEQTIFRYLYAKGYLYEFFDTLSENNQRKQMTEDILTWNRLSYKRVVNPLPFYESHAQALGELA